MSSGDTNPNKLAFWKRRIIEQNILDALKMYPEHAKTIFGVVPVMRGNVLQLSMILAARQILATPQGQLTLETSEEIEKEFQEALDALPDEAKALGRELFSAERQEESIRLWARRMIEDATGFEPS